MNGEFGSKIWSKIWSFSVLISEYNLGPDFRNEILNFTFFSVIFDKNPFQTII